MLSCVAPLWEELMFRGFLLPGIRAAAAQLLISKADESLPAAHAVDAAAIALCAALFASVHASPMGFVPLFALGLVFGGAYKATGNLLPCVCLHALWNVAMLVRVVMGG
ncbi:hypothetical protein H632_c270p3 [Helicosporidium sp. ATCC 50920]|nr:hypothetical protein H632_c270p3 [Helicosporidium sp. ATCC 50920]|eukprot:KDD76321.1 hypothetical protein H632_c270p3 [Helicosporidium sp. ATCC 50920]